MISIIKMISAFFLLSLFTILGSQARMLPAEENGIFKTISNSINYNKEKKWISMVADQIITSSFMISNYRKKPAPSPPPPRSATPLQPGINDYSKKSRISSLNSGIVTSSIVKRPTRPPPPAPNASSPKTGMSVYSKKPRPPPPSLLKSVLIISGMIKKPAQPPPPAPGASPMRTGISDYQKKPKSSPPPPYTSPTKGHLSSATTPTKPGMSGYAIIAKSPPPPPYTCVWTYRLLIAKSSYKESEHIDC